MVITIKIYDISMNLSEETIIYPGSEPIKITQYATIPEDVVNESFVKFGCHSGTHIDAPRHIDNRGKLANEIPLNSFLGLSKVLDLTEIKKEIHAVHLKAYDIEEGDIILLKTKNSLKGFEKFHEDFVHVKIDAARYLVEKKVKTLCFDYLSVKKFEEDNDVHKLLINNLTLFEGVNLKNIKKGRYFFVGLPLRLRADGSPARCILIEDYNL